MRDLVRRNSKFFLFSTAAAIALRLFLVFRLPSITNDSLLYGDIAKNWLKVGVYGLTINGQVSPTLIRLPGYPAFLALVFSIVGVDHYRAVLILQVLFDIGTCFLIADLARRLFSLKAAKAAFLLAALCPFLADYAAAALTETLEIFFTTLALDLAVTALGPEELGHSLRRWIGCGLCIAMSILLRPDGGLLLITVVGFLLAYSSWRDFQRQSCRHLLIGAAIVAVFSLAPLIPWALRNLHTLHRFQPLAPRYANEEGELVLIGFNRWVKTWIADYTSVEEIYWNVPGDSVDPGKLPSRAFDSDDERKKTDALLTAYNSNLRISAELDQEFNSLASERIRSHPARYYIWLPLTRILDMWMRPRTELVPSDPRWWEFNDVPLWSRIAVALGLVNIFYIVSALSGLREFRLNPVLLLLLLFVMLRSLFLGTLENPETRYTLEMYPVVIVFAARGWSMSNPFRN